MLWVIAYDIADNRRRRHVEKVLLGLGGRVQWSVFECYLSPVQRARVEAELAALIDPHADSIRFYPLCHWCNERVIMQGDGRRYDDEPLWVF